MFNTKSGADMKIYDYNEKKNICGERIRSARKAMHLSQQELAARLQVEGINVERDSISRMEIGARFIADFELMILCKVLNVSADELLGIQK